MKIHLVGAEMYQADGQTERYDEVTPLNAELNPICHLLALLGAHHIVHVGTIRVNSHFSQFCGNKHVTDFRLSRRLMQGLRTSRM